MIPSGYTSEVQEGLKLAWLAGFMDGEGSFYAILEKRPANRSGIRMQVEVTVANTKVASGGGV